MFCDLKLFNDCRWCCNWVQSCACCPHTTASCQVSTMLAEQLTCRHWWTESSMLCQTMICPHRVYLRQSWDLIYCTWLLWLAWQPNSCWRRFVGGLLYWRIVQLDNVQSPFSVNLQLFDEICAIHLRMWDYVLWLFFPLKPWFSSKADMHRNRAV